jgi:hypothetical protein
MRPPSWLIRLAASRFEAQQLRAHARAEEVQEKLLRRLLDLYRHTEVGRTLGIAEVTSGAAFRAQVPARASTDYLPLWNRVITDNRPGLLHPKALACACISSGTSGEEKYIPCPEEQVQNYRRFVNHAFFHAFHMLDDYSLMAAHMLITAAPPIKEVRPDGLVIGYGSGVATAKSSGFARRVVRPTPDILGINDGREKVRRTIEQAFPLDVRVLTGIPMFVIGLLEELLAYARQQGKPAACARDVWPNLRLYSYSGTSIALHEARLRQLLGPGVELYEVYSATECPVAFQYRRGEPGLLVDLSAGYFEFQPVGSTARVPIHETEVGAIYDLVVTTFSGAFAYKLGDRVEVLGKNPYLVRYAGRAREEINVGGEKVTVEQARAALEHACQRTGASFHQFFVCPAPASSEIAHEWHVEFATPPADARLFMEHADRHLTQANAVYREIREGGGLVPRMRLLPAGAIDRYVAARTTFGQGKFLNLYNDRRVAEHMS